MSFDCHSSSTRHYIPVELLTVIFICFLLGLFSRFCKLSKLNIIEWLSTAAAPVRAQVWCYCICGKVSLHLLLFPLPILFTPTALCSLSFTHRRCTVPPMTAAYTSPLVTASNGGRSLSSGFPKCLLAPATTLSAKQLSTATLHTPLK
jgi:hypothetical protein